MISLFAKPSNHYAFAFEEKLAITAGNTYGVPWKPDVLIEVVREGGGVSRLAITIHDYQFTMTVEEFKNRLMGQLKDPITQRKELLVALCKKAEEIKEKRL